MADDFIRSLGSPMLSHRLRRASEMLLRDGAGFVQRHGFTAPARAGSTLLLLRREGVLGLTEIARRIRFSHPLVIKLVAELLEAGLVREQTDPADQRRRLLRLTAAGQRQAERLEDLLAIIAATYADLFAETGIDLLAGLERLDVALARRSLDERLEEHMQSEETQSCA
jgi:DNA-binding MarR family transcriptional regulator